MIVWWVRNVVAPSYLSEKEQKAYLKTVHEAPLCKFHKEPCAQRTVVKPGPNLGKKFWVCPRPNGLPSDKEARCNFFAWVE
ncbi:hypothetical protein T484DRAFT_1806970 [Baffinella frigidus]|nr:hypothetical protein T484DRAFT_1806970 [Cryptophyta sp. CCMP2293]